MIDEIKSFCKITVQSDDAVYIFACVRFKIKIECFMSVNIGPERGSDIKWPSPN